MSPSLPLPVTAYWESITVQMCGLLLQNQSYFMKTYGMAAMPVIMGKTSIFFLDYFIRHPNEVRDI